MIKRKILRYKISPTGKPFSHLIPNSADYVSCGKFNGEFFMWFLANDENTTEKRTFLAIWVGTLIRGGCTYLDYFTDENNTKMWHLLEIRDSVEIKGMEANDGPETGSSENR